MRHEPPAMGDGDDEYDTIYVESATRGRRHQVGRRRHCAPLPEHEALAGAIPQWVLLPEHEADTLDACLGFAAHDHPAVRAAAAPPSATSPAATGASPNRRGW